MVNFSGERDDLCQLCGKGGEGLEKNRRNGAVNVSLATQKVILFL